SSRVSPGSRLSTARLGRTCDEARDCGRHRGGPGTGRGLRREPRSGHPGGRVLINVNLTPSIPIKRRSPWGVWVLSIVTFGIYYLIWYYNINREMAEANPTRRVSPLGALMAITF